MFRALAGAPRGAWGHRPALHRAQPRILQRAELDAAAMFARFSNPKLYRQHEPLGEPCRTFYAQLAHSRCEALGARVLSGVQLNLAARAHARWLRARPEATLHLTEATRAETLALLARLPLQAPISDAMRTALQSLWPVALSTAQAAALRGLAAHVEDEAAFLHQTCALAQSLFPALDTVSRPDDNGAPPGDVPRERGTAVDVAGAQDFNGGGLEISSTTQPAPVASAEEHYRVFTRQFDVLQGAQDLCDRAQLSSLRGEIELLVAERRNLITRWAHRLQRHLQGLQRRTWEFDLPDGVLDASRLTRLVTQPLEPAAYKRERESAFTASTVTMLIDNSGSMRGQPIAVAALCTELLSRALERCGVSTEILGFTTLAWRGGRAYQQWLAQGRPPAPGRLTELRHVVYKGAQTPWRHARGHVGAMLAPGLLKENVDGEALRWAVQRLRGRSAPRKVLLVISDGAPLDEVTAAANDAHYLERDLRRAIAAIEARSAVQLIAIGIGHDVSRYYRQAVHIPDVAALSETMVSQLSALLARRHRGRARS